MKPRLCRSSWRALASTHPLMLPSTCSREALVACPPCPPWNLPSLTVESTLSSSCSRSDPPHSRQGAALAHLDSLPPHDLVLWTDGSVPFPFGKGSSGVLANCSLCGTGATLSFSAGPVCSSFSAEACAILHALCWSRQHHKVCHFSSLLLLSDSRSVLTDSRTNTPGQIPTGQIPTGQLPPLPNTHLTNTPWTYTHHKMKCEEKP